MSESLMTLKQASEFLQIDPDTLRALTRRGRVPAMKIGRQWRFDLSLLREWVQRESLRTYDQGTRLPTRCSQAGCCNE